jgi:hypothetical protein
MKRLLFSLLLLGSAFRAEAVDYTGLWYNAAESGYGYNLVQSDDGIKNYIFATFFIYGPNGQPTWYSAGLEADGNGNFTGSLNATVGTYFAAPWIPGNFSGVSVGTVTFTPSTANVYTGTMVMAVNGAPVISKSIEMQTLKRIVIAGSYAGGQVGTYSGCAVPADNFTYTDKFDLVLAQSADGTAEFVFDYSSAIKCTLRGTLVQHGQLYSIPSATYVCSGAATINTTASMSEIKATSLGIEGRFFAPNTGSGCAEGANFAGVLF